MHRSLPACSVSHRRQRIDNCASLQVNARVENALPSKPLALEESRYRFLVEAVTDYAIYMLDATGVVDSWNPGAERIKGYSAAEIVGQHFSRFYPPEDRAGRPAGHRAGDRRSAKASSKAKAGGCARTAAASGPT